jgi:hypothetical protein
MHEYLSTSGNSANTGNTEVLTLRIMSHSPTHTPLCEYFNCAACKPIDKLFSVTGNQLLLMDDLTVWGCLSDLHQKYKKEELIWRKEKQKKLL